MHALPSLHATRLLLCTQPLETSQLSSVHTLLSSQSTTTPGRHVPSLQPSPSVHALPSEQDAVLLV